MSQQIDVLSPKFYNPDPISGYITVFIEGKQYTVRATDPNFNKAVEAYKANNLEELLNIISPALMIQKLYAKYENIEVKDGNVFVYGETITSVVASRILTFLSEGIDCVPIFKFITRLQNNPSKRAVDELYTFLEHRNLPITDNGTFVAYKALRNNYTDKHTGKFDNTIGNVLEMPRNRVDDNKEVGCSYGFHAGTHEYASGFAMGDDRLVLVEIDPADVVSIPTDCEFQKLRTCKYKVIAECERPITEYVYPSDYTTEYDDDIDREWNEDDNDTETCNGCGYQYNSYCVECEQCGDCCECDDDDVDPIPDEPKTEVQLKLNLDNKMHENWLEERFQYLEMLPWLYRNRRPAVGNAMKNFYKDIDDHHLINPKFAILNQFTSEEDAYRIYKQFKS